MPFWPQAKGTPPALHSSPTLISSLHFSRFVSRWFFCAGALLAQAFRAHFVTTIMWNNGCPSSSDCAHSFELFAPFLCGLTSLSVRPFIHDAAAGHSQCNCLVSKLLDFLRRQAPWMIMQMSFRSPFTAYNVVQLLIKPYAELQNCTLAMAMHC